MPKFATKAADNMFCQARYEAAKFNERLSSREGAAEELGVDRTRLARIELGSVIPYPEEVLLMADIYRAPELKGNYCREMCLWEKECQRSRIRILIGLHSGIVLIPKDQRSQRTPAGYYGRWSYYRGRKAGFRENYSNLG